MNLLRVFLFKEQLYTMKSSRDIALEYQRDGVDVIHSYGKKYTPLFIDDLGVENNSKFYGNECNTIGEILLQRYELLTNHQIVTHATTNLNADELEKLYGKDRKSTRLNSSHVRISYAVFC